MGNNSYRNNNDEKERRLAERKEALTTTLAPMTLKGTEWDISTPKLSAYIVDLISEDYKIPEIDSIYVWPEKNKAGQIETFSAVAYFLCDNSGKGNIKRIGQGSSYSNNGTRSFRPAVTNKSQSGNFTVNDKFKESIAGLACLDDDNRLIINSDPDGDKNIAVVSLDFWKMVAVAMEISNDSPYDFEVIGCAPVNNQNNCLDFVLTIKKFVTNNNSHRSRNGKKINYDSRNRKFMNGGGRR